MDREGACLTWPSWGCGVGRRTGAGRYVPCPSPRLLGGAESHTSLPVPGRRMAAHFRMYATAGRVTHLVPKYQRDVRGKGSNEHSDRPGKQWPPQSI